MITWQIYLRNERIAKNLKHEQEATKRKIGAFLDAATTGKLWNNEQQPPSETNTSTSTHRHAPKPRRVSIAARTAAMSTRPRSAAAPLARSSSNTRRQSETKLDDFFQISSPRQEEEPTQRA